MPGARCEAIAACGAVGGRRRRREGRGLRAGSGIRSILRNGAFLVGSASAETALRGLYMLAIGRLLGPEGYGIWAYAVAASVMALGLTGFGLDTILPLRLGRERASRAASGLLGAALALRAGALVLAGAALAAYAAAAEPEPAARLAIVLVIPALLGRGVALWARSVFVGYERAGLATRIAVGMRAAEVVCGVALMLAGFGLTAILALHAGAWLLEAALGLALVRRRLAPSRLTAARAEIAALARDGAALGLAAALGGWLTVGPLLLLRQTGAALETVGQFGLAMQVAMIGVLAATAFLQAVLPVLGRSVAAGDPRVAAYGGLTAAVGLGGAGLAALAAVPLGKPLLLALLGPGFSLAGDLLAPCLLLGGLMVAPIGYWQMLVARGRRWPGVVAGGLGAVVLGLSLPPAVAAWGVHGAVLAAALGLGVRAVALALPAARAGAAPGGGPA